MNVAELVQTLEQRKPSAWRPGYVQVLTSTSHTSSLIMAGTLRSPSTAHEREYVRNREAHARARTTCKLDCLNKLKSRSWVSQQWEHTQHRDRPSMSPYQLEPSRLAYEMKRLTSMGQQPCAFKCSQERL
ncbi:hypothetical protein VNO77_03367 [Canavalia gladiata]|uniref:Uncharacterized protein n=1 Tax=Canavalia gladiata TaxID=3824 RepID=A0AAN9MV85_CANGL